jgi:trk system potassium uptake protein TrkH
MKRTGQLAMIAHDMGLIFEFLGIVSLLPFLVLAIFGEWDLFMPMATAPATFLVLGFLISNIPHDEIEPSTTVTLAAISLSWLAIALIGALPFVYGLGLSFTDSVFEAMSGWTGTGFTMLVAPDATPKTLLFWRSFTHWIGGIGIIAFSISLRRKTRVSLFRMYKSEGRVDEVLSATASTSRRMWMIYLVLTFAFTGLVMMAGLPLWDALNLVMAAIATGAFTVHAGGIGYYNNPLLEALLIPVMITGAIPFKFFLLMYGGKVRDMLHDRIVRALLIFMVIGSLLVSLDLWLSAGIPLADALRQGTFTAVSGLSTCGLQNTSLHAWPAIPLAIIGMLVFIGGSMGSAAGGVKVNRILLMYHGVRWWFRRFFVSSRVMVPFRFGRGMISGEVSDLAISKNMLVIIIYVLTIFTATILILHLYITSFAMEQVVFELVSALSNTGLSVGFISAASPITIKWIFITLMWLGRLEIVPVLILGMALIKGLEDDSRSQTPPDPDFLLVR